MAEEKKQSFNLGLTIVALVALVSIVSLVALVLFSAKSPRFATGGQIVSAQDTANEQNIAGKGAGIQYKSDTQGFDLGAGGGGGAYTCTCAGSGKVKCKGSSNSPSGCVDSLSGGSCGYCAADIPD